MNEGPPNENQNKGCSRTQGCIVVLILLFFIGLTIPGGSRVTDQARLMQACSNARQIIMTLKNYAGDHDGRYPDEIKGVQTSNDAFRVLFKRDLLEDERAFTAASSPYEGDNHIGTAPDFTDALTAGENHWSMVAGMREGRDDDKPLIFENSLNDDQWPPRWNCDKAGQKAEGRAWKSGKIVIGRNDGSVAGEPLDAMKGDSVSLQEEAKFFPAKHDGLRILDVAR